MKHELVMGALLVAGLALAQLYKKGNAAMTNDRRQNVDLDALYRMHGLAKAVDWRLLKALAIVESTENPAAMNPADPSTGLMQVLCSGPGGDAKCTNPLPAIPDWPPTQNELLNPDRNVHYGAQIIAWNIRKYGFWRGVAVYNRWASRLDPVSGPFGNQGYVDKVKNAYRQLGGTQ